MTVELVSEATWLTSSLAPALEQEMAAFDAAPYVDYLLRIQPVKCALGRTPRVLPSRILFMLGTVLQALPCL